jgi:acyl-CoA reductase-like NAD-dependent aldehyde dehydrogenase
MALEIALTEPARAFAPSRPFQRQHWTSGSTSSTGSTAAAIKVAEAAARTVKRVSLELGGKSANIVLEDADLEKAARWNVQRCFFNTGQSCHALSRALLRGVGVGAMLARDTQRRALHHQRQTR